jgi:hypothetical protein
LLTVTLAVSQEPAHGSELGGQPGAFSRMGFGARGIGMGNAMVATTGGDVVGYYNPALLPLLDRRVASATMGILSLDRRLNFLSASIPLPPNAGLSVGLINAGVSEIDGRDADGRPTGLLQTSENQAFLSFAIRFKPGFSLGLNLKLYYYHLYTDISSTTVGIDVGGAYPLTEELTLGVAVRDINSKYKWDTSSLYGQDGQASEDRFPLLYIAGASYRLPGGMGTVSAEIEHSDPGTTLIRAGAEVILLPEIRVRAGLDRADVSESGNGVRPTFGFTLQRDLEGWIPAVNYAFVVEPFAPTGMHLISVSATF